MTAAGEARPHVLVMDDAEEVLGLLRAALEEEGYRVSSSPTVVDLDGVKRLAPDLILLDLVFGGEPRGLPFLRRLRGDPVVAGVPVVVCSGAVDAIRRLGPGAGGGEVGLVLKPFDLDELLGEMRALRERGAAGSEAVAPEEDRPRVPWLRRATGPPIALMGSPPAVGRATAIPRRCRAGCSPPGTPQRTPPGFL